MTAYIYKSKLGDCSMFGISSKHDEVLVVGMDVPELTEYNGTIPAVKIRKKKYSGNEYICAEPIAATSPHCIGWMAGGCFIWSCDSRFRESISEQPVPLHDRQEPQQERGD